ncbi:hypothetical protein TYRP_019539 [Tyrophagus putrescentiae]|nr:hypothetical protein TYRP_019539 [Tyrophagus putrescentiae]
MLAVHGTRRRGLASLERLPTPVAEGLASGASEARGGGRSWTTSLKLTVSHRPQVLHEKVGDHGDENGENGLQQGTVSGQQFGHINK